MEDYQEIICAISHGTITGDFEQPWRALLLSATFNSDTLGSVVCI